MMTQHNIKPDIFTYTTLISVCNRALRPKQAKKFFKLMLQDGIEPDTPAYNVLMNTFAKSNDIKSMEKLMQKMFSK